MKSNGKADTDKIAQAYLNIPVPSDLRRRLKMAANASGQKMRDYVVSLLNTHTPAYEETKVKRQ